MARNPLTPEQREKLKQTLASGSRLGASDLRLINIDVYRERLGKEWFKYKGIIHALAAAAIKTELGPQDFYVETKTGYGIFFFKHDLEQVQVVSDRIAERLQRELSREPAFGDPPLGCEAVSVNCDEFLRQLEAEAQGAAVPVAEPPRLPPQLQSAMHYAPLWHTKVNRIVGSIHTPIARASVRRFSDNEYYMPSLAQARHDLQGFGVMLNDAYKLHKAGKSATIIFSLNFKAFCAPEYAKEYMLALRQTPSALLQYLTPRFVRIPPGTPQTLLATKVQLLSTIFRHVVLHSRPHVEHSAFEFVPCSILSTSWKDIHHFSHGDPKASEQMLRAFSRSAKRLRLNALVEGLEDQQMLESAIAAGIDFASGEVVQPYSQTPFHQRPLTLGDIRATPRTAPAAPAPQPPAPAQTVAATAPKPAPAAPSGDVFEI